MPPEALPDAAAAARMAQLFKLALQYRLIALGKDATGNLELKVNGSRVNEVLAMEAAAMVSPAGKETR